MSTQSSGRIIDQAAFLNILNSRKTLKTSHVGLQVILAIQGIGTFLPKGHKYAANGVDRENQFDRTIYNLKANSQLSMMRDENKQLLSAAMKADSAGNVEDSTKLFNEYLNNVQVSFSVIEPSQRKFASGDMVTAIVAEAIAQGTEAKQLVVNDVRYKAPTSVEATKFDITDLIASEEGTEAFAGEGTKVGATA